MKKNSKVIMSLIGVASLLGGLSSCGGNSSTVNPSTNNGSNPSQSTNTSSISDSTPTSDESTVNITFWHTFGQGIIESMQRKINEFSRLVKEKENVTVNITLDNQGSYDDLEKKILNSLAIGSAPNIAVAYPDHVANYLSQCDEDHQFVVNLDTYLNDAEVGLGTETYLSDTLGEDDIVPAFLDEGKHYSMEGTYSFPLMKSTEVMFYNERYMPQVLELYNTKYGTDHTSAARFLSSINWDEFMDLCQVINDNKDKFTDDEANFYPAAYDSDSNMFISQLIQSGNQFISIDAEGNGVLDFDSENGKAMVTDLKADYDKGLFVTKGTTGEYGSNLFKASRSVFSIGSSGGASYNEPTGQSFSTGICKVPPRTEKGSIADATYVSQGPTLTILNALRKSPEQQEREALYSWKFIKYIINTENNVDLALDSGGYIPIRLSAYEDENYAEYLAQEEDFLSRCASLVINGINGHYFNTPVFKGSSTARDQVGGIITQVMTGQRSVEDAFKYAVDQTKLAM